MTMGTVNGKCEQCEYDDGSGRCGHDQQDLTMGA